MNDGVYYYYITSQVRILARVNKTKKKKGVGLTRLQILKRGQSNSNRGHGTERTPWLSVAGYKLTNSTSIFFSTHFGTFLWTLLPRIAVLSFPPYTDSQTFGCTEIENTSTGTSEIFCLLACNETCMTQVSPMHGKFAHISHSRNGLLFLQPLTCITKCKM